MTLLLGILAMLCGFLLGCWCIICAIEKYCPTTWRILGLELENNKKKREEARQKEVSE